jgi:hypothetical protein
LRTIFLTALLAAALLFPASAHAAPFAIGSGAEPGLAVDAAGTAYIAYNGRETGSPPHFCRLPRGATACDVALTLPVVPTTDTSSRPTVTVAGARVTVVVYRSGQQTAITRYTSTDGGVTFPNSTVVGGNVPNVESVTGPGDTVSVVTLADSRGGLFHNVPLSGSTPAGTFATLFDGSRPYRGTVGLIDAATPLAIFATGASFGAFRRYDGSGDVNDAANWTAPVDIGYVDYPRLAGGPSGLFLVAGDENFGLFVRKWDGTTFGPRVTITDNGDDSEMHVFQDAARRLHVVYASNRADGYHAVHAVSDDGINWRSGSVAVQTADEPSSIRVAAAPDHVGIAAWRSSLTNEIRVAAIGPDAPVDPLPPPAPPAPTSAPAADPVPQFHKTVVVKRISGKVRVRLKGSKTFTDLGAIDDVPLGATVDVKQGRIELASVPSRTAAVEKIQLYSGMFRIGQPAAITEFTLNEPLASCKKKARASETKPKSRKLWGDGKGKFRTRGQYSAATIRGTRFLVQDSCSGTLTQVKEGSVLVRDNVKRKNIVLRKGKRYTARPRR